MTITDLLNSSYIDKINTFSIVDMILALSVAFGMGIFIYLVYRKTYRGVVYSDSFAVTLIAMTLITTMVILAVTSNVVLSLGMVGALSIVRFRSAVKDPIDIAFVFWSMVVGIVIGAGFIPLATFGSVFIGIVLVFFVNRKPTSSPYVMVITYKKPWNEKVVIEKLNQDKIKYIIKSKVMNESYCEITLDLRMKEEQSKNILSLSDLEGVDNVSLVSYNGEYLA